MLLRPVLDGTDGYAAMWLVTSLLLLGSLPLMLRLRRDPRMAVATRVPPEEMLERGL